MKAKTFLITILISITSFSIFSTLSLARYYEPQSGRFIQTDPEPGKLDLPVSVVNSYAYVGNNPVMRTDPTGKSFWSGVTKAFNIARAITALVDPGELTSLLDLVSGHFDIGQALLNANNPMQSIAQAMVVIDVTAGAFKGDIDLEEFEGRFVVHNSIFVSNGSGFTTGPVVFLGNYDSLSPQAQERLKRHEFGHTLQYDLYGGWAYTGMGITMAGRSDWFECDAARRAGNHFDSSPYTANYSCY